MPQPPPSNVTEPEARPKLGGWALGLFLAAAGLVLVVATSLIWIGPLTIALGVFALAGLHYVIWGWWLSHAIRREAEADESATPNRHRDSHAPRGPSWSS